MARALLSRGDRVSVSTRGDGPRENLTGLDVVRVHGDDGVRGTLEDWIPGHELVVDAGAPYALYLHDPEHSHAARVDHAEQRMRRLLTTTAATGATLVHVSSILTADGRHGTSLTRRLVESAHPYFRIKQRMEALAIDAARAGQPVAIVNPSALFGPWNPRPFESCYVSAVLTGSVPASYPETVNVIDVRDAAECILRVAVEGWYGRRVPIAGHDITVHDLTDRIIALGGGRRPYRGRGLAAGAAALYLAESALGAAGLRSPYPSLPVLLTLASGPVRIGGAQRALGPTPRPLDDTLNDEIAWHSGRGCP